MSESQWRTPLPVSQRQEPVKWWASLRFRTAMGMAVTSLLIITVFGSFAAHSTGASALARLRSDAVSMLNTAVATYSFTGTIPSSISLDSRMLPGNLLAAARTDTVVSYYDGHSIWAAQTSNGHVLSVEISDTSMRRELGGLLRSLLWSALAGVAMACIIGWAVASELTSRLRTASQAAQRIGQGELTTQINADGRDEVATLSNAVDHMASSLATLIEREKTQTADAAHELKTPLTALVSSAELLEDSRESTLVRSQVKRLRTLVEELLELDRLTSTDEKVTLGSADLGGVVARFVAELPAGRDCELSILNSVPVLVEEHRLERVLVNLVNNSYRHGNGPVAVTVDGASVSVSDQGAGYPEELLLNGPRRLNSSGKNAGSGLGLIIASQYAQSMSAVLTLRNNVPFGALSTVALLPALDSPQGQAD